MGDEPVKEETTPKDESEMFKDMYVATIMDRFYLGDSNYFYFHSFTIPGTYDAKNRIFIDQNGLEYMAITDPKALKSEVTRGYHNLIKMNDLPKEVGEETVDEAIPKYDELCSRFVCYVSYADNGMIFVLPINYISMKEYLSGMLQGKNDFGGLEQAGVDKVEIPYRQQPTQQVTMSDEETDVSEEGSSEKKVLFSGCLTPEMSDFLKDMLDGKIPLDELRKFRARVKSDPNSWIEAPEGLLQQKVNINDIHQKVIRTLIAQDEPARRVITEVSRKLENAECNERGLLITGQTGCGKTKLMQLIAKYLGRPFIKIDSTQLTVPGYVGKNLEEEFWKLLVKCGKNVELAEHAVVCFGEIDKKGSSSKEDVGGRGVLNVLLPVFDGTTYDACENMQNKTEVIPINTKNMLIALDGAFEDVYKELNKRGIGFGAGKVIDKNDEGAVIKAFIDIGQMTGEFMGRVDIIKMNDLDLEHLERVLRESDESPIEKQRKAFERMGVKLTAGDDFVREIADRAVKRKSGCRGLDSAVNDATWEAYGDAHENEGAYEEIILGRDTIDHPKQYTKIPRKSSEE